MKLIPLGVYGAYPQRNGGTSAYLVRGAGGDVVLDFGSGALSRLQNFTRPEALAAVVLSHLHSDHMSDMLNLRYYFQLRCPGRILDVYLPDTGCGMYRLLEECPAFRLHALSEGLEIALAGMNLTFLRVEHPVPTFGMRVKEDGAVLAYPADTRMCVNLEKLVAGSSLYLADAALTRAGEQSPHAAVGDIAAMAARLGVPMLLTHLSDRPQEALCEAQERGADAAIIREMETYVIGKEPV